MKVSAFRDCPGLPACLFWEKDRSMIYFMLLETEEDKNRFAEIYEENYLKMYHVALGMIKNKEDAENAVHEAFLSLAENFTKYSRLSGREFTGLCVSIVKNKVIDDIRRRKHYSEDELEELVLYDEDAEHDASAMAEKKETEALVKKALEQVSEVLRETLVLKYYYELGNGEIAEIQGVSKKVVEMRLLRGKQKLKEVWDERED